MTTAAIAKNIRVPHECWMSPDANSEEFPKYEDGFPEDLILNEEERKILESLPPDKAQKIINERINQRYALYTSYL